MAKEDREDKIARLKKRLTLVNVSLQNATNQLQGGKVIAGSVIDDLYTQHEQLRGQIARLESGEEQAAAPPGPPERSPARDEEEFGIPDRLRVRRRPYTLTTAAFYRRITINKEVIEVKKGLVVYFLAFAALLLFGIAPAFAADGKERQCSGARGTKVESEKTKRLIPHRLEQLVKGCSCFPITQLIYSRIDRVQHILEI
jgi:hypothetical protein